MRFLKVFMDQNNRCNLRCRMCGFSDPRVVGLPGHDMPMWLFRRVVDEVFPHAHYVALSCLAEPFMTRDITQRLDLLRDQSEVETEIITNGTLLTPERIGSMIENRISRIGISIDGASRDVYERIRVGAKFDRVIGNIKMINEMKAASGSHLPALRFLHVISELNVDHFDAFLAMAEELSVDSVDMRTIQPFVNADDRGSDEAVFWEKIKGCKAKLDEWLDRTGVQDLGYLRTTGDKIDLFDAQGEMVPCNAASKNLTVLFNGDVVPCTAWSRAPVGNLARQSFDEIWNGAPALAMREEFAAKKPGRDCHYCTIIRDDPEVEGDAFFKLITREPAESEPPRG
jgi:radical SAM protein with 4Fe4S-binding SPASM domain